MSIQETVHFDNQGNIRPGGRWRDAFRKVFLALVILLVATFSYGAGRLNGGQANPGMTIRYDEGVIPALSGPGAARQSVPQEKTASSAGSVYASSKGTKYYYPNCKSTILEANKITFASALIAEKAGYTLATNCQKP